MEPLNPTLFRLLKNNFGSVLVTNEGEAMSAQYIFSGRSNRDELRIASPGEYYRVNCNRCNDTRHRLWINHMWGRQDERGRRNLWLAVCYNENCYNNYESRYELLERISEISGVLDRCRLNTGVETNGENKEAFLPGPVHRLDKLSPDHPANRYLSGRFYDPERLGRYYKVGWCPNSLYYLANNRIIAPIYFMQKLVGWQARYVGDMDWKADDAPPKWWTDPRMKKNHILYNYDNARNFRTGVVMEGPGDVWNFGPMGVATLGSSMSLHQCRHLVSAYSKGACILLWDPDVQKSPAKMKHVNEKVIPNLEGQFKKGFGVVWLPDGYDPGNLDRRFLREYVAREAKAQGVKVSWSLKS